MKKSFLGEMWCSAKSLGKFACALKSFVFIHCELFGMNKSVCLNLKEKECDKDFEDLSLGRVHGFMSHMCHKAMKNVPF